jgi:renalase
MHADAIDTCVAVSPPRATLMASPHSAAAGASAAVKRLLVVGSGPTGALLARMVRTATEAGTLPPMAVTIMDKGRTPGGRMSTSAARAFGRALTADLGAQYITRYSAAGAGVDANSGGNGGIGVGSGVMDVIYDELLGAGVLEPLQGEIRGQSARQAALPNYCAPAGMAAMVAHIAASSGAALQQSTRLVELSLTDSGTRWRCGTEKLSGTAPQSLPGRGVSTAAAAAAAAPGAEAPLAPQLLVDEYDAVVITMPAPQVLQLRGGVQERLASSGWASALSAVRYSSRYALALYYGATEAAAVRAAAPFTAWYVPPTEDDVVRYVSVDTRMHRRGQGALSGAEEAGPLALVVHTSIGYGAARVDDLAEAVQADVLQHVARLMPGLPPPTEVKCHRWRYSQVTARCQPPPEAAGGWAGSGTAAAAAAAAAVAAAGGGAALVCGGSSGSSEPPLILAGDSFTESSFEGCAASAVAALRLLRNCVGTPVI